MNAGRGHQAHQKEAHSLQKGGKTKYKRQKRHIRVRDGGLFQGGSHEGGEVSKQQETLSSVGLWGVLESQRAT